eukprot:scaffold30668_cov61-Phaeocystis_antarctica.AAC.2
MAAGGAHGARGSARRPAEAEHLLHVLRLRHLRWASPRRAVLGQRRCNAPAAHAGMYVIVSIAAHAGNVAAAPAPTC